ncbi:hypothetical protein ACE1SV_73550 [Streptomyces sp. E-15]
MTADSPSPAGPGTTYTPPTSGPGAAFVAGGASGIGPAIAHRPATTGRRVVILGRGQAAGEVAAALGPDHHLVRCDVSQEDQVAAAMAETADRVGSVEVLVNNAGRGLTGQTPET